jgi:GWxTD domain-containing protein
MKAIHAFCAVLVLLCTLDSMPAQPRLILSVDFSRYRGDSVNTYLEIYYSFSDRGLQFQKTPEGFKTSVVMTARILNLKKDTIITQKRWRVQRVVADTALETTGQGLVGSVNLIVPKGEYYLSVKGQDEHRPENVDSLLYVINANPVQNGNVAISDIELCTSIKQGAEKDNIFYKNTLEVVPNPSMLYGVGMPLIFYYAEVYNLLSDPSMTNFYTRVSVFNTSGKEILHQDRKRVRSNESSVEVGTMNVSKLPNGTYSFFFALTDSLGNPKLSSGKKFFIYNPNVIDSAALKVASIDVLSSEYATMSEEELDKEFHEAMYLESSDDKDKYSELKDVAAKRKFIFDFWRMRDSDPLTLANETKEEYLRRVEYANTHFKAISRTGYRSDRGRVYCMYGPPDEIQRHPNEGDIRPYEIWEYHSIQGGVIFVFVDRSGFSDYQLVHSTHRDEMQDNNWQDKAVMTQ